MTFEKIKEMVERVMKTTKKLIVCLMALVMMLGTCMTVYADNTSGDLPIASIKSKSIKASSQTIYTNDPEMGNEAEVIVNFKWNNKVRKQEFQAPTGIKAESKDRGVVKVLGYESAGESVDKKGTTTTTYVKVKLEAVSNGKTKLVISDKENPKNKKEITITVKTYAEDIAFKNENVSEIEDNTAAISIVKAKNATVNLGAYVVNDDASNKTVKYAVDKVATKALSGNGKTYISVDKKGNVKVSSLKAKATVIKVTADKVVKAVIVTPDGQIATDKLTLIKDSSSKKAVLGMLNGKNVLTMKGNKKSEAYTYQLNWKEDVSADDLIFTSSKESVATVDDNGLITAVGNGKSYITVTTKAGNKLKSAVKITVNVSTDVEYVKAAFKEATILANGKDSASIKAYTNPNASNKGVTYDFTSVVVKDDKGNETTLTKEKDIKKVISVKKGVVTAKKSCTAEIRAYATADDSKEVVVTVNAVVPVTGIKVATESGYPQFNSKKQVTVYREDGAPYEAPVAVTVTGLDKLTPDNDDVYFKSANDSVAKIVETEDGWKLVANKAGKVKIDAYADDSNQKKATYTVTVKVDAYDITTNADENHVVWAKSKGDGSTKFTLSKEIAAATNADASNKKLSYKVLTIKRATLNAETNEVTYKEEEVNKTQSTVKLNKDDEATVQITASDARTHGNSKADKNYCTEYVVLKCVPANAFATKFAINLDADSLELKKGETAEVNAEIEALEEGKRIPTGAKVAWKTGNKKVATVSNGVITAKGVGKTTITVSYEGAESKTIEVFVGRDDAAVEKEIEALISGEIKAENRDYTGIVTEFNAKNNNFGFRIIDPYKEIDTLKDTGMVAMLKGILKNLEDTITYNAVEIYDMTYDRTWTISVDGIAVTVLCDDEVVLDKVDGDTAVAYVVESLLTTENKWADWNNREFSLTMNVTDTQKLGGESKDFNYALGYSVNAYIPDGVYEQIIDAKIAEQLSTIDVAGVECMPYDDADNTVEVLVTDGDMTVAEAYALSKDTLVSALQDVFEDASMVTMTIVTADGRTKTATKDRAECPDDMVEALLDEKVKELSEKVNTFEDLDGFVITATVEYEGGYRYDYAAMISLDESVYDELADYAIHAAVLDNVFTLGSVGYTSDDNTLTVAIAPECAEYTEKDLEGTGIKSIIDALVENERVTNIVVINDGETTTIKDDALLSKSLQILMALSKDVEVLSDLDGKEAIIKVTYASGNGASKKTIAYTIAFELEEESTESDDPTVSGNEPPVEPGDDPTVSGNEPPVEPGDDPTVSGNEPPAVSGNGLIQ